MTSNSFLSRTIIPVVLLAAAGFAQATPVAHPAIPEIPEIPASKIYQVRVDGMPVPVNDESHFDFHTAFFSMGKPVTVEVEFSGASYASIHPVRHGFEPKADGKNITFRNCRIGGKPVKSLEDIQVNEFVSGVKFQGTE